MRGSVRTGLAVCGVGSARAANAEDCSGHYEVRGIPVNHVGLSVAIVFNQGLLEYAKSAACSVHSVVQVDDEEHVVMLVKVSNRPNCGFAGSM